MAERFPLVACYQRAAFRGADKTIIRSSTTSMGTGWSSSGLFCASFRHFAVGHGEKDDFVQHVSIFKVFIFPYAHWGIKIVGELT